jgi:hypothetical protein
MSMIDSGVEVDDLGYVDVNIYLAQLGFDEDAFSSMTSKDVVLAPGLPGESIDAPSSYAAFSSWASDIGKVYRGQGLSVGFALPEGVERREILRKAADVLLPPIVFFSQAGLAVGLNILANWLYEDFIAVFGLRRVRVEVLDIEADSMTLHRVKYEGPADEVAKILRSESKKKKKKKK